MLSEQGHCSLLWIVRPKIHNFPNPLTLFLRALISPGNKYVVTRRRRGEPEKERTRTGSPSFIFGIYLWLPRSRYVGHLRWMTSTSAQSPNLGFSEFCHIQLISCIIHKWLTASGTWFGEILVCCCLTSLAWLCLGVSPNHVPEAVRHLSYSARLSSTM